MNINVPTTRLPRLAFFRTMVPLRAATIKPIAMAQTAMQSHTVRTVSINPITYPQRPNAKAYESFQKDSLQTSKQMF
jgi:hypothetical protein